MSESKSESKGKTVTFLGGEEDGDPTTVFQVGSDVFPINEPVPVSSAKRAKEVEDAAKRSAMKVKIGAPSDES